MRTKTFLTVLLAVSAAVLLAACQVKEEEPEETVFGPLLKLAPADAADHDSFGLAVALDGDLALVGAPGFDGGSRMPPRRPRSSSRPPSRARSTCPSSPPTPPGRGTS